METLNTLGFYLFLLSSSTHDPSIVYFFILLIPPYKAKARLVVLSLDSPIKRERC